MANTEGGSFGGLGRGVGGSRFASQAQSKGELSSRPGQDAAASARLCEGRRHARWASEPRGCGPTAIARSLGRIAAVKDGSVWSYRILHRELGLLAAPSSLLSGLQASMRQEAGHHQHFLRLAAKYGGQPGEMSIDPFRERSLFEVAYENMVVGCVQGAIAGQMMRYQSRRAKDPEIAHALHGLAKTQRKQVDLAEEMQSFFATMLGSAALVELEVARSRALKSIAALEIGQAQLGRSVQVTSEWELDDAARYLLGAPDPAQIPHLIELFQQPQPYLTQTTMWPESSIP